ncbi:MAG: acetyl-CoA hydrolase [Rhodospirillales bacterium]|nr:MAG: acetyl-CoA hydrolase [Rhodospirillales bacterium]
MPRSIAADAVPDLLRPGLRVYAPGLAGESPLFARALTARAEKAAGVHFTGVWLPGFNRADYASLHETARATAFFVGAHNRASFADGRVDFLPLSYFSIAAYMRDAMEVDLALLHTSPPDDAGRLSLGIANDFTPEVLNRPCVKVAHINPLMPRTVGAATVALGDVDYVVEEPCPLPGEDNGAIDPVFAAIGRHVAGLVRDGDTVEVGIGRVQGVLAALHAKRHLALHAGAVTDPLLGLVNAGALRAGAGAVTAGIAWGSPALYDFVTDNPTVRFAPVSHTHNVRVIGALPRFVAINTVIEVDLLGQANAEMVGGRQISSAGGLTDFMRGARVSPGGFSVIALEAAAKGGTVSRIVPALTEGTAVSAARGDVDYVVTEHGVADLRHASVGRRAEALIAVAAPPFRDDLTRAWQDRRRRM